MPDGTNNIYVDLSFITLSSGTEEVYVDYSTREADSIGERIIPIEYLTSGSVSGISDVMTKYFATYSGSKITGYVNSSATFETSTLSSGVMEALTEYARTTISGIPGSENVEYKYYTGLPAISGTQNARLDITVGDAFAYSTNVANQYWIFGAVNGTLTFYALYTAGKDCDPTELGDCDIVSGTNDYPVLFSLNTVTSGVGFAYVDSTFAGYPINFRPEDFTYLADVICGLEGTSQATDWEAEVVNGAFWPIDFDLFASTATSGSINFDAHAGLIDLVSYSYDVETITGNIGYIDHELYCGVSGVQGFSFNVSLLSLKISNFSLAEGEYVDITGSICVDITDDVHNVVTSGTYFIIDSTAVSGTFTPITDGYRMCYDLIDVNAFLGSTTFTVHAENDNGDILEKDYYLTSGYTVEYDNINQGYGYDNQVVVRMTAENLTASCPVTNTDAYWFTTQPRLSKDLGASIVGIELESDDLTASITPQTGLIYFYGKTFRVEIRAKDFAGNEMTPYTFEFKIEDEPD